MPLADQLAQVAVRGGDDADIRLDRLAPAHRGELAFLQHAQQAGLRLGRHVADLVQEQRAAGGLLEAPDAAVERAGEGAALMAEQAASISLAGGSKTRACSATSAAPSPARTAATTGPLRTGQWRHAVPG